MTDLRVLLVEDQTVLRQGLRQLIESEPGMTVAGEAGTVAEAVALAARLRPDVVLLDLKLPDGSGLDAARRILTPAASATATAAPTPATADEPPAVLVLSTYEDVALIRSALELGASGYLPKTASFHEIASAVRAAAAGTVVLHPSLAAKVARPEADAGLTAQELAMLRLLAEGASYGEIGARIYASERTVRRHMNALFAKLGCAGRAQAVAEAMRRGLVT